MKFFQKVEFENQKKLKEIKKKNLDSIIVEIDEENRHLSELIEARKSIEAEISRLSDIEVSLKVDISKLSLKYNKLCARKDIFANKMKSYTTKLKECISRVNEIQCTIDDYSRKAASLGEKIVSGRTIDNIELEIQQTEKIIHLKEQEI